MTICSFPKCGKPLAAKLLCQGHYTQLKLGKLLTPLKQVRKHGSPPLIAYIESRCPVPSLKGPCHLYSRGKTAFGYGKIYLDGKSISVHRYVWELTNGPIPKGMLVDHQCRNRSCCNVDHLRIVTPQVNVTENSIGNSFQLNAAKTHCPSGHEYTPENTYLYKRMRMCKACRIARDIKRDRANEKPKQKRT